MPRKGLTPLFGLLAAVVTLAGCESDGYMHRDRHDQDQDHHRQGAPARDQDHRDAPGGDQNRHDGPPA